MYLLLHGFGVLVIRGGDCLDPMGRITVALLATLGIGILVGFLVFNSGHGDAQLGLTVQVCSGFPLNGLLNLVLDIRTPMWL